MSAIYILWMRSVKRYVRSKPRIIAALGQPLLFLIALGFGFGPIFQRAGQGNYIQFLAPGVIAMTVLFTAIFSGIELIWDRQFGFLKETLVVPVPRILIMIGRTLGGATIAMIQGLIVVVICFAVGFRVTDYSKLPIAIGVMILVAVMFTALGTAIASVLSDFPAHHEFSGNADLLPFRSFVPVDQPAESAQYYREHRPAVLWSGRPSHGISRHRSLRYHARLTSALHHHRCPAWRRRLLVFEDPALAP